MTPMDEGRMEFPMRLNRYMALCGVAARRKAEILIASGRVTVNGETEMSVGRVLEGGEDVRFDGAPVLFARRTYMVMNKPRGVLSAVRDTRAPTVLDLLPDSYRPLGLFPAGRLDKDSEGLIILTNDGKFANRITHPSSGVKKTYIVNLSRILGRKQMKEWERGVIIYGRLVKPLEISPLNEGEEGRCFRIVLGEGLKREVRLMAEAVGNRVSRLKRIGIGGLFLKKLPSGMFHECNYSDLQCMISSGGEV
jgi:23S rRNA pseudouridine2605 synthase